MLEVAIACENSDTDARVYAMLLGRVLGTEVRPFEMGPFAFFGWPHVYSLAGTFLGQAAARGVRHALLAVDNDGGAKKFPEHDPAHPGLPRVTDKTTLQRERRCRVCTLSAIVPSNWIAEGRLACVVVPVQTLETWVLCVQNDAFREAAPEKQYHRGALKKLCYGTNDLGASEQRDHAISVLSRKDAVDVLRQRASFRRFEDGVRSWAPGSPVGE